ncbi:MAG TPA: hypothetical protein VGU69_04440 [Rhizomicrobium sp.]|nr:hypothetical protein [Rhizomicrobium sp.]
MPVDLAYFLRGEVEEFHHADHVWMAFEILKRHDFLDAAKAYAAGLKQIAARGGQPSAFHMTITVAFLSLVAERMAQHADYPSFAAANPDLFDKRILARWYPSSRLQSEIARATFILPEPRHA